MSGTLTFCIAEEAQELIRRLMRSKDGEESEIKPLLLTQSRDPSKNSDLPRTLAENDPFPNDFNGMTVDACRECAMEICKYNKSAESDTMVIADERSARDGTVSFQTFMYDLGEDMTFPGYGTLPSQSGCWHEWRIDASTIDTIYTSLFYGEPDAVYPVFFGERDRLTDEHGVFDVERAERWAYDEEAWADHIRNDKRLDVESLERKYPSTRT